jgi:hypothetical protein
MHHLFFNPWAILASAVLQWILGAIWFSPLLFAKPWKAMVYPTGAPQKNSMAAGMIVSFIGSLILSFVLAHFIFWAGASTLQWGAMIGFIAWVGFIVAPLSASHIYEGRPFNLFAINTGYWLVAIVATGALLAIWR